MICWHLQHHFTDTVIIHSTGKFVLVYLLVSLQIKSYAFRLFCLLCSENADDTFRRLSAMSPFQVAEILEQANVVADYFRKAADERRTTKLSSAAADNRADAAETLDEIKCPLFAEVVGEDALPDSLSAGTTLPSADKTSKPPMVKSPRSQVRGTETKKSLVSAQKENKAPATAVLSSVGRKPLSGASKANTSMSKACG